MPEISEHEIGSVEDYIALLPKKLNYDSNPVFRGHGKLSYKLVPDIYRFTEIPGECTDWNQFERSLIVRFQKQAIGHLTRRPKTLVDWICLARHHGLPTRLLDWSDDPLTSLWFALQNRNDHEYDGCVWQMSSSALLASTSGDFSGLDTSFESQPLSVVRYYPKHISPRITAQRGLFSIQQSPKKIEEFVPLEKRYTDGFTGIRLLKYVIPAASKSGILHKLDRLGIDAFRAFPDLDGLCDMLKWEVARDVSTSSNPVQSAT